MILTRMALRNPVSVLMISVVLLVLAAAALFRIPIDTLPNLTIPALQVVTPYTGADPHTVEQSVTYPMEKAISSVSGISYIQSVSREGISVVRAYFNWGTNLDTAEVEAIQRANGILNNLPPGVGSPIVLKFDISNFPVIALAVQSRKLNQRQLYDLAYNTIEPAVEHLDGVSSAPVNGGQIRQINVLLDRSKLAAHDLTIQNVYNVIGNSNFLFPSGDIEVGRTDYRVYTKTQFERVEPMNSIVVANRNGIPVHLSDIGKVLDSSARQTQIVRINGVHGVMMFVSKEPGRNTVEVVKNIKNGMKPLLKRLHETNPDVEIHAFFDQSIAIHDSIQSLSHEAMIGAALAGAVILVFLRNFMSTGFVSISMPLSAMTAVFLLFLTGQTFNVFTLGGLALAMGRLVDDAIVVIENIYRHVNLGEERLSAVLKGTQEVGMPVLASTITTVIVFLPVVFLQGITKILFTPLAATVAFSLLASYVVSLTIIPVLSRYWLTSEKKEEPGSHFYDKLSQTYAETLQWVLRRRGRVIMATLLLFLATVPILPKIGKELIPQPDENMLVVFGRTPVGTRLRQTEKIVAACESVIRKLLGKDVSVIVADMGIPSVQRGTNAAAAAFSQNSGPHGFTIRVNLVPASERRRSSFQDVDIIRKSLIGMFPGVTLYPSPAGITYFLLNLGAQGAIDVQVQGYDLDKGFQLARQVAQMISTTPGAADARIVQQNDYPEIHVDVNREKASLLGLNQKQIADTVLTAISGNTQFNSIWTDPVSGNQYNLITQYPVEYQQSYQDIRNIAFQSQNHVGVPLRSFANISITQGPLEIDRQNEIRMFDVTANAVGKPLGTVAQDLENQIAGEIKLPQGFAITVAGQYQSQKQSFSQMPFALFLALLLVYAILATQFRSFVDPFIIIFTVPLGFVGVFWTLFLTRTSLSIESFMGIITMIGIVVSNGILLVDFANQLRRKGLNAGEAVVEAAKIRLRPILMTAIATIVGLIPMGLGIGAGSETHEPLARAVIGGLTVSTFLTLFFVPVLYTFWEKKETQIGDAV